MGLATGFSLGYMAGLVGGLQGSPGKIQDSVSMTPYMIEASPIARGLPLTSDWREFGSPHDDPHGVPKRTTH